MEIGDMEGTMEGQERKTAVLLYTMPSSLHGIKGYLWAFVMRNLQAFGIYRKGVHRLLCGAELRKRSSGCGRHPGVVWAQRTDQRGSESPGKEPLISWRNTSSHDQRHGIRLLNVQRRSLFRDIVSIGGATWIQEKT